MRHTDSLAKGSILAFLCVLSIIPTVSHAQIGNYVQIWGGPQYVALKNFNDYSAVNLSGAELPQQTYRMGAGVDYIHNFNPNYGLQTGLYYSGQGQKYSGNSKDFYNPADTVLQNYTSSVTMDYVKIPLFVRFNSVMQEQDRLNLSIFVGLQIGYLLSVRSSTWPGIPDSIMTKFMTNNPDFKLRQLFNNFDFGLGAGAQFNFKVRDWEWVHLGIRFDRSFSNIENINYVLPADAPLEYQYPVSTKKDTRESHLSVITDYPSQNISVNVYVGFSFRVKQLTFKPPIIRDDDSQGQ